MMKSILGFLGGTMVSILEGEIADNVREGYDDYKYKIFQQKILERLESKTLEGLEAEKLREWIFQHESELKQQRLLIDDKKEFLALFYKNYPETKYMRTKELDRILEAYIDGLNEWGNKVLSDESKITISVIKEGQRKQGDRIIEEIKNALEKNIEEEKEDKKRLKKCTGYGERKNKCDLIITEKASEYCQECNNLKFKDKILQIYKIQNYTILEKDGYFVAEQKSGIIKSNAAIISIYSNRDALESDIVCKIYNIINKCNEKQYQQIHIVTNRKLKEEEKNKLAIFGEHVKIYSEQEIINEIMDFSQYLEMLINKYEEGTLYNHYIEMYDENTGDLLEYTVKDFLCETERNAFLILGDYGCGKTSFLMTLGYHLAKEYMEGNSEIIPIFVPLKEYSKSVNLDNVLLNIFVNKCYMSNVTLDAFKLLMRYKKFVILFDGFDEVAKRVNYDVKFGIFNEICKYCSGKTKVLVTCRPNYFQEKREYKRLIENAHLQFEPTEVNNAVFEETFISELSAEQIEGYIDSYKRELRTNGLEISEFKKLIENTHDLKDLSKRPFLLNIIIQTLPRIITAREKTGEVKINAAELYKKYTEIWLDREISKDKTLISKEDKMHFCIHIAYKMFRTDILELHYSDFPKEIKEYFKDLHIVEDVDYFSHDIQSCSFMNSDGEGNFKFIHKSFMEYFVGSFIAEELKDVTKGKKDIEKVLSIREISSEIALFINDILEESPTYYDMISVLQSNSRHANQDVRQNIFTILSKTKANMGDIIENENSYESVDLSRCIIKDTIVQGVDFSNVSFYDAYIENVMFINCNFADAFFQKAILKNVDFSELNMEYTDFSYSHINGCNFTDAYLVSADFSQAIVEQCDFDSCDMSGVESWGTKFADNHNYESAVGVPYEMN